MPTQSAETVAYDEQEKPFDASDPKQVNESRKKEGRKKKKRLDVIAGLMAIPEGREWVWEKLVSSFIFSSIIVPNDHDQSMRNEGRRMFALELLADVMDAAEDKFMPMCRENKQK